jgi:hypothetical protein
MAVFMFRDRVVGWSDISFHFAAKQEIRPALNLSPIFS